jgi:hypothetical protein
MLECSALEHDPKTDRERKTARHDAAREHRRAAAVVVLEQRRNLAGAAARAACGGRSDARGPSQKPLDEIEVEGHQLGRGLAVVFLVIGSVSAEVRAEPICGDAQNLSEFSRLGDSMYVLVAYNRADQEADQQNLLRCVRGLDHGIGVFQPKCEWRLAEDVFSPTESGHHVFAVIDRGYADVDRVDRRIIDERKCVGDCLRVTALRYRLGTRQIPTEDTGDIHSIDRSIGERVLSAHRPSAKNSDADL